MKHFEDMIRQRLHESVENKDPSVTFDQIEKRNIETKVKKKWINKMNVGIGSFAALLLIALISISSIHPQKLDRSGQTQSNRSVSQTNSTLPPFSKLIPGTYFGLQSFLMRSLSYATSNGEYVGIWKHGSTGVETWLQDMKGNKYKVSSGKYYIVGSTPTGSVIFSDQKTSRPSYTYPSFVYQPKTSKVSDIPKDPKAKVTQYASQSVTGSWAAIEMASKDSGYRNSWVDINGKRVKGLDHAQEIAWSPNGSKLAVLVAVDATPKGQGSGAWRVIREELCVYDVKTGNIARSKAYMMSGLSWSPDGKIIAVDFAELRGASLPGFHEFRTNNLQELKQFNSIRDDDWSWIGGHTAIVSNRIQSKPDHLVSVSWNLKTGKTHTANILNTSKSVYGMRAVGLGKCLVQDQQGLLLVQGSKVTRIVGQPIQTWWYDDSTNTVYYVMKTSNSVQMKKLN